MRVVSLLPDPEEVALEDRATYDPDEELLVQFYNSKEYQQTAG